MMLQGLAGGVDMPVQCSRARCTELATVQILWRNPKIHNESRRKTWLACTEHEEFLTEFLRARNFPLTCEPYPDERGS